MRLLFLITLLISSFTSLAQAQMSLDEKPSDILKRNVSFKEYEITDQQTIEVDGKKFTQLTFDKKNSYYDHETNYESMLLSASLIADTVVAVKFMQTDPRQDKLLHFYAGYLVGNVSNGAFQLILPKTMKNRRLVSALLGVGMSALVGGAKEYYDSRHPEGHTADSKDFLATVRGGMVGSLTLTFDLNKAFSRQN